MTSVTHVTGNSNTLRQVNQTGKKKKEHPKASKEALQVLQSMPKTTAKAPPPVASVSVPTPSGKKENAMQLTEVFDEVDDVQRKLREKNSQSAAELAKLNKVIETKQEEINTLTNRLKSAEDFFPTKELAELKQLQERVKEISQENESLQQQKADVEKAVAELKMALDITQREANARREEFLQLMRDHEEQYQQLQQSSLAKKETPPAEEGLNRALDLSRAEMTRFTNQKIAAQHLLKGALAEAQQEKVHAQKRLTELLQQGQSEQLAKLHALTKECLALKRKNEQLMNPSSVPLSREEELFFGYLPPFVPDPQWALPMKDSIGVLPAEASLEPASSAQVTETAEPVQATETAGPAQATQTKVVPFAQELAFVKTLENELGKRVWRVENASSQIARLFELRKLRELQRQAKFTLDSLVAKLAKEEGFAPLGTAVKAIQEQLNKLQTNFSCQWPIEQLQSLWAQLTTIETIHSEGSYAGWWGIGKKKTAEMSDKKISLISGYQEVMNDAQWLDSELKKAEEAYGQWLLKQPTEQELAANGFSSTFAKVHSGQPFDSAAFLEKANSEKAAIQKRAKELKMAKELRKQIESAIASWSNDPDVAGALEQKARLLDGVFHTKREIEFNQLLSSMNRLSEQAKALEEVAHPKRKILDGTGEHVCFATDVEQAKELRRELVTGKPLHNVVGPILNLDSQILEAQGLLAKLESELTSLEKPLPTMANSQEWLVKSMISRRKKAIEEGRKASAALKSAISSAIEEINVLGLHIHSEDLKALTTSRWQALTKESYRDLATNKWRPHRREELHRHPSCLKLTKEQQEEHLLRLQHEKLSEEIKAIRDKKKQPAQVVKTPRSADKRP